MTARASEKEIIVEKTLSYRREARKNVEQILRVREMATKKNIYIHINVYKYNGREMEGWKQDETGRTETHGCM